MKKPSKSNAELNSELTDLGSGDVVIARLHHLIESVDDSFVEDLLKEVGITREEALDMIQSGVQPKGMKEAVAVFSAGLIASIHNAAHDIMGGEPISDSGMRDTVNRAPNFWDKLDDESKDVVRDFLREDVNL